MTTRPIDPEILTTSALSAFARALATGLLSFGLLPVVAQAQDQAVAEESALYESGVAALKAERGGDAKAAFRKLVKKVPDSSKYHFLLAMALQQTRELGAAWQELRSAYRLAPKQQTVRKGLSRMWNAFDRLGTFNVGNDAKSVAKVLGKPDSIRRQGKVDRWFYAYHVVNLIQGRVHSIVDLRGVDVKALPSKDRVHWSPGEAWRAGYRATTKYKVSTEYVLPRQRVQNWRELVTVERLLGVTARKSSPRAVMEGMRKNLKRMRPDAEWKVLAEDASSITYHWRIPARGKQPAQHEIAKLVAGTADLWRVAYVRKLSGAATALPERSFEEWNRKIGSFAVRKL